MAFRPCLQSTLPEAKPRPPRHGCRRQCAALPCETKALRFFAAFTPAVDRAQDADYAARALEALTEQREMQRVQAIKDAAKMLMSAAPPPQAPPPPPASD